MQYLTDNTELFIMKGRTDISPAFPVALLWAESDPLVVTLGIDQSAHGGGHTQWVIGRELLWSAIIGESNGGIGEGDVSVVVKSAINRMYLRFDVEGEKTLSRIELKAIRRFLEETDRVIPIGMEPVSDSLDQFLNNLLD